MREYKRSIDKATREIEKERTKLQNQEKKIIADIKKAAKDGQMVSFSSLADFPSSRLLHDFP
jgi:charged multivesicular body protein 2A